MSGQFKLFYEAQSWIEPELSRFIGQNTPDEELASRCLYSVMHMGLRERSWLIRTAGQVVNCDPLAFTPMALSAECFIAAALTSDDVLDDADERWGGESCVSRWGLRSALLIAEQLHGLAHLALDGLLCEDSRLDIRNLTKALREFRGHYSEFFSWQFTDIQNEGKHEGGLNQVHDLAYRRTGRLLHACAVGPALAGGANEPDIAALSCYGRSVGTLLQLRDDILDYLGERTSLGKPVFEDLVKGQPNIISHFLLASQKSDRRDFLLSFFGRGQSLNSDEEREVRRALQGTNIVEKAMGVILAEGRTGLEALMTLPASRPRDDLALFLGALVDIPT